MKTDFVGSVNILMHELSHMWFGDLVTMKWWGDIWLNESFATLISYLACDSLSQTSSGKLTYNFVNMDRFESKFWLEFNNEILKAYTDDLEPTTHPIEAPCENSREAEELIDGITYGKGAAFIRILMLNIGFQNFIEGCRLYFKRYAWQNCTLDDFISCM